MIYKELNQILVNLFYMFIRYVSIPAGNDRVIFSCNIKVNIRGINDDSLLFYTHHITTTTSAAHVEKNYAHDR